MLITIVLLPTLLFIAGLLFMAWFNQFFCAKATNSSQQVHHKKEVAKKKIVSTAHHDKAELRSVFATFDKNKDGFITRRELRESLANIGIHMTEIEVGEMVEKVDSNGDGLIDLDEFCELFESVMSREEVAVGGEEEGGGGKEEAGGRKEEELKEAFDIFDGDKDGLITVEELGLVLSSLGLKEGKRLESCKEMIKNVDMDGDGMVNFDEFKRMMKAGGKFITVS